MRKLLVERKTSEPQSRYKFILTFGKKIVQDPALLSFFLPLFYLQQPFKPDMHRPSPQCLLHKRILVKKMLSHTFSIRLPIQFPFWSLSNYWYQSRIKLNDRCLGSSSHFEILTYTFISKDLTNRDDKFWKLSFKFLRFLIFVKYSYHFPQ